MTTKTRLFRTFLLVPILFLGLVVFSGKTWAASFVVDDSSDGTASASDCENGSPSGNDCSLRDALTAAESATYSGDDTISFAIGTGNVTISITSTLPSLGSSNGAVEIDGTTQPSGYVVIDGTSWSGCCYPINIQSSNNVIKGLVIVNMPYSAIGITANGITASNNQILGNYLGYNPVTSSASGNTNSGIFIQAINDGVMDNTMIGDGTTSGRNIISGNGANGIHIDGDDSTSGGMTNLKIWGNYIGVAPDGSTVAANTDDGISVEGGNISYLQVGGPSCEARWSDCDGNVISGNTRNGVWFWTTGTGNDAMGDYLIQNNYIGVDSTGEADKGNGEVGVQFTGDISNITILDNLISGNTADGITFNNSDSNPTPRNIVVAANMIGTDDDGTTVIGNGSDGIDLQSLDLTGGGTTLVEIGSPDYEPNLISGNAQYGIRVDSCDFDEGELIISQNVIGLNSSGDAALGNGYSGIFSDDVDYIQIGRSFDSGWNIISGNGTDAGYYGSGIEMIDTSYVKIRGNAIGTDANAESRIYNEMSGIKIDDSSGSPTDYEIGSKDSPYYGNLISGSGYNQTACDGSCHGIEISDTDNIEIYNNIIGLDINESSTLDNYGGGIMAEDVGDITIGSESAPNRVAGNDADGIDVTSASGAVKIIGNTVGSSSSLNNGDGGVTLMWSVDPDNLIAENSIEHNTSQGILMFGATAQIENNTISNNGSYGMLIISSETYAAADPSNSVSFSAAPMIYGNDIQNNSGEGIYLIEYEPSNLSTSTNSDLIWDDNNGTEGNSTTSSLTNNNSNGDQVEVLYFGAVEVLDENGGTVTSLPTNNLVITDNQSNIQYFNSYVSAGGGLGVWGTDNFLAGQLGSFAWALDYDTNWGYFSWPMLTAYTIGTSGGSVTNYNPYTISVTGPSSETGSATFSWDGDDSTHPVAPDFDTRAGNLNFSSYKRYQIGQVMYDQADLSSPDLTADPDAEAIIDNEAPLPIVVPDDGSSSTSPTNEGEDVTFTITAKDWNNDTYYFAVCKTDAIAHNGTSAPTCPGGEWGMSTTPVASDVQATVTYETTGSETCGESCAWYAFACEAVTNGECMPPTGYGGYVGQGSAMGYVEFSAEPEDEDQVTLAGDVYEFDKTDGATCSGGEDYCVNIGGGAEDASDAAYRLVDTYHIASTIATNVSNRVYIYAIGSGSSGNSIGITEPDANEGGSSDDITFSGTTLGNGLGGSVTDDQASPFKVNHRPVIGTVNIGDTTGGTGTIEAGDDVYFNVGVTDSDTDGSADTIDMHVCLTNSFTEGSGCDTNQTICKTVDNAPGTLECNSEDSSGDLTSTYNESPVTTGQKTVYIFVEDSHDLRDAGTDNLQNYTLTNSAPAFIIQPSDDDPWVSQTSGTSNRFRAIHCYDSDTCWTVGYNGEIRKTTNGGDSWSQQTSNTTNEFFDVQCTDSNNCWAVGMSGTIRKTTDGGATAWSDPCSTNCPTGDVWNVHFVSSSTGWIVGASGDIRKTTNGGVDWAIQTSGTSNTLYGLHCTDSNTCWAVGRMGGGGGEIRYTSDGGATAWSGQTSPQVDGLISIYCYDSNTCWAAGQGGGIIYTSNGGSNWGSQTSGVSTSLNDIHFIDANKGWAVGNPSSSKSVMLVTTDGGSNWYRQRSGNTLEFYGVYIVDSNTGWVVGSGGRIYKGIYGSSNTYPTNADDNISYKGTATDDNGDNYWLIFCNNSTTPTPSGSGPECNGGSSNRWGLSSETSSGTEATASYTTSDSDAQQNAWYSFVCDASACSAYSQGTGNSGSPFEVNHRPEIGTVTIGPSYGSSASVDPGNDTTGVVYFQVGITDADSAGTADTVDMYVCSTDSFTPGVGCAAGLCFTLGKTAGGNAECGDIDLAPIPTTHGTKTVYIFIVDNHDFQDGDSTHNQTYDVTDVAPVVISYSMTDTLDPAAGGYDTYAYTAVVSDNNGDADIEGVEGWFYDDTAIDLSSGQCSEDENDCYKDQDDCSLNTSYGTNIQVEATCSTNVWFNANASTGWKGHVNVEDETTTVTDGSDSDGQTNSALQGITAVEGSIAYGTVGIGRSSAGQTITLGNMGNQVIDVLVDGDDMCIDSYASSCPSTYIPLEQQKWHHTSSTFNWSDSETGAGPYALEDDSTEGAQSCTYGSTCSDTNGCLNRDIAVRDGHAETATNESFYWKILIPVSQATGTYYGENVVTATASNSCTGTLY